MLFYSDKIFLLIFSIFLNQPEAAWDKDLRENTKRKVGKYFFIIR